MWGYPAFSNHTTGIQAALAENNYFKHKHRLGGGREEERVLAGHSPAFREKPQSCFIHPARGQSPVLSPLDHSNKVAEQRETICTATMESRTCKTLLAHCCSNTTFSIPFGRRDLLPLPKLGSPGSSQEVWETRCLFSRWPAGTSHNPTDRERRSFQVRNSNPTAEQAVVQIKSGRHHLNEKPTDTLCWVSQ